MKTGRYILLSLVLLMSCEEDPNGPTADFTYTTNYLIVSFTDASTPGDGAINTWAWDFGDGETSGQQNPTHTYTAPGTYSATLTVTDENDLNDTYTEDVTVEFRSPTTDFTYTANYLIVSFTDASTPGDGAINTWAWDFGDGSTSAEQNSVHTYAEAGTYTVSLTVTDENDLNDTYTEDDITVEEYTGTGPAASFGYSVNFLEVTFTDISTEGDGAILTWAWDFGDGNTGTEQNPVHTYAEDGIYSVTLTVTDENSLVDTYTKAIEVLISVLSLTPESLSIDIGSVGELTLNIEDLEDAIFGISLRIAYDSTGVSFAGSTEFGEGYFFGSEAVTFVKDTSSTIHIATTLTSGEGVFGSGILYTLEFEGKSEGSHLVEILSNFLFFYDSSGSKVTIPNLTKSATINVE